MPRTVCWWSTSQPLGYAAGGDALVVLDADGRKLTRFDLRQKELRGAELDVQSPGQLAVIPATPAKNGANVRMIVTKRPMMIVMPPYLS